MCELVEMALERAEESLRRISGSCQLRKTGNPSVFCSSLPTHWRSNKSLPTPFVVLALYPIPDGTKITIAAGSEENNTADVKNNVSEFNGQMARFSDLRFVGKSGRGKNFNLTITLHMQPVTQIIIVDNVIKVTVDGPRDSRNCTKYVNGELLTRKRHPIKNDSLNIAENFLKQHQYNTSKSAFLHSKPSTSNALPSVMPLLPTAIKAPSSMKFFEPVKGSNFNEKPIPINKNTSNTTTNITALPNSYNQSPNSNLFIPNTTSQITSVFPPTFANANPTLLNSFFAAAAAVQFAGYTKQKMPNRTTNSATPNIFSQPLSSANTFSSSSFPHQAAVKANLMSLFGNSLINPFLFCNPSTYLNTSTINTDNFVKLEQNLNNTSNNTFSNRNTKKENHSTKTSLTGCPSFTNPITTSFAESNNPTRKRTKLNSEPFKENCIYSDDFLNKKLKQSQERKTESRDFKVYSPDTTLKMKTESGLKESSMLWRPYDQTSNSSQSSTLSPNLNTTDSTGTTETTI